MRVTIRVEELRPGRPPLRALENTFEFTYTGYFSQVLNLGPLARSELKLTLSVDRTYRTAGDPRMLGVAVYPLFFLRV